MDRPQNINLPALYAGHPAPISWDPVGGVEGYSLERKINNEPAFQWIYTGPTPEFLDLLPVSSSTATYRVQAFDTLDQCWSQLDSLDRNWDTVDGQGLSWYSEHSDYTVLADTPVTRVWLSAPTLHAGNIAQITWTDIHEATGYLLERKLNSEPGFHLIYSGRKNIFTDNVPELSKSITYRVAWYVDRDHTWNEMDTDDRNWDELDSLDRPWVLYESLYTVGGPFTVIPNRPPVISGQNADLGTKYRGFPISFSATDPDPGNTIHLTAAFDGTVIFNVPNAQQGAEYTVSISDAQILAMAYQSRHSIIITATDNKGASATRIYTFTAVEDLVSAAVFYILRDGQPVAKLPAVQQWTDYLEVGTHRYMVRGVDKNDNYSDSNEVTVTITVNHATLALAESPGNYLTLSVRRNERPKIEQNIDMVYSETMYEGRAYPVYECTGQRRVAQSISFTTRTLAEQSALFALISSGGPLVYRDLYDTRIVGVIPSRVNDYQGRFRGRANNSIVDYNLTINQCDFNEVRPYD